MMATDKEIQDAALQLAVTAIKALTAWLDGKASIIVATRGTTSCPTRYIRLERDPT